MLYQECSSYLPTVATRYTSSCRCLGASFRIFLATTLKGEASTPYNWFFWGGNPPGEMRYPTLGNRRTIFKSPLGKRIWYVSSQQFHKGHVFLGGISAYLISSFGHQPLPFGCYYYQPSKCTYKRFFFQETGCEYTTYISFLLVDCLYICLGLGPICWCNGVFYSSAAPHKLPWTHFLVAAGCTQLLAFFQVGTWDSPVNRSWGHEHENIPVL